MLRIILIGFKLSFANRGSIKSLATIIDLSPISAKTYSISLPTAIAWLAGSVHGVVVRL